jgi:hypothetical protein
MSYHNNAWKVAKLHFYSTASKKATIGNAHARKITNRTSKAYRTCINGKQHER